MLTNFNIRINDEQCMLSLWQKYLARIVGSGRDLDGCFFVSTRQDGVEMDLFCTDRTRSRRIFLVSRKSVLPNDNNAFFIEVIFISILFTFSVQFGHIFDSLSFRLTVPAFSLLHKV